VPDFKVQRGSTTLTNSQSSNTGTITAVGSTTKAFTLSSSSRWVGGSAPYAISSNLTNHQYVSSLELANTTTVTVRRGLGQSPTETLYHEWEVLEYTGSAGGANEFIVRQQDTLSFASGATTALGAEITGIVNVNDCVIIPRGAEANYHFNSGNLIGINYELEASGANWKVRANRGNSQTVSNSDDFAYTVVEFTGSNWTVQKVEHTYAAAGVAESETITSVGSVNNAFVIHHHSTTEIYSENVTSLAYLNSATQIRFELDGKAITPTGCNDIAYVVSNPTLTVTHYNGDITLGTDLSVPLNITLTAVSSLSRTATVIQTIMHKDSSGSAARPPTETFTGVLNSTSNYRLQRSRDASTRGKYRLSVIQFPTGAVTSTVTTSLDALLAKQFTKTVSADALIQATKTISTSADALLQKTLTISVVADAILAGLNTLQFDADAMLSKQIIKTFLADALLETPGRVTFRADAIIEQIGSVIFSADAILSKGVIKEFFADALLVLRKERTISADALIQKQRTVSFQADAVIYGRWTEVTPPDNTWTEI